MLSGECFVCFDDNAPPSACGCVDRYLHRACLQMMVEASGSTTCPVCQQQYPDVRCEARVRRTMSVAGRMVATQVGCLLIASSLVTWRWLTLPASYEVIAEAAMLLSLASLLLVEWKQHRRGLWYVWYPRVSYVVSA